MKTLNLQVLPEQIGIESILKLYARLLLDNTGCLKHLGPKAAASMGVLIGGAQGCDNPSGHWTWPGLLLPCSGACCSSVYFHKGDVPVVRASSDLIQQALRGSPEGLKSQIKIQRG